MEKNFLELEIESIHKKLNVLASAVEELVAQDNYKLLNIQDIAKMLGLSAKTLYKKPWLLPNFGETKGKMEWTKKEVVQWLEKGTEALLYEYRDKGIKKALSELDIVS